MRKKSSSEDGEKACLSQVSPAIFELSPTEPTLRVKLTPLIILVAFVIGGITPWLYQKSQRISAQREATYIALKIATNLKRLSARSPVLWAYQPQAVSRSISPLERLGASIKCQHQGGRVIYQSDEVLNTVSSLIGESTRTLYLNGEVPVIITVMIESTARLSHTLTWMISSLIAGLLSWLLWRIPLKSAYKADKENQRLLRQITDLNSDLELRVQERTTALEKLNERLLTIQEEERARISRDLHDELGQTLTGLRLHLTTLALSSPSIQHEVIKQSLEIVDLGIDQVRTIAYEQHPPELTMLGLIEAVKAIAQRITRVGQLNVSVIGCELPELTQPISVAIFRLCQEGITNAIRHSKSLEVEISFEHRESSLMVYIEDDGIGIADQIKMGGGLNGLMSRISSHQGRLTLQDSSLGGIALIAELPLSSSTPIKISKKSQSELLK